MLETLYQEKLVLFQELNKVTDEIVALPCEKLVEDDDALEKIQKSLETRQDIMDKIEEVSLKIRDFSKEISDPPGHSVLILQKALQEEIRKIQAQNKNVEGTVKKSLVELRQRTKKAQDGRQTNRAYAGRITDSEGSFIDKRR
ncbi:MAG: hypothetical protein QM401_11200 [Bacillota bacterium]|nr:hypothetical protein [Bacillota bacterium]